MANADQPESVALASSSGSRGLSAARPRTSDASLHPAILDDDGEEPPLTTVLIESPTMLELVLALWLTQPRPLVVAADVGFAPHAMVRPDGSAEGFNVDLAAEIAERLGRPGYEIVDSEWSGMFAGLNAKKFEFVVAPMTATPERAEMVLFSEAYLDTDYTFLIAERSPEIASLTDLRGKTIAVNNGSAYDTWASENKTRYGFEVQRYGKNADAIQAVLTRRAFANLAAHSVVNWAATKNPLVKTSYTIHSGRAFALAFRKDDAANRNRVEEILECMKTDGTLARIHEKWLGETPGPGSAAATVYAGYGIAELAGFDPTDHTLSCR